MFVYVSQNGFRGPSEAIRSTKTVVIGPAHRKKRTGQLPQQLCRPSGSDFVHFGHLDKHFIEKEAFFCAKSGIL